MRNQAHCCFDTCIRYNSLFNLNIHIYHRTAEQSATGPTVDVCVTTRTLIPPTSVNPLESVNVKTTTTVQDRANAGVMTSYQEDIAGNRKDAAFDMLGS